MKKLQFITIGFISVVILLGCGVTNDNEGVIRVKNSVSSNTDIKDIYIRRANTESWGHDKLIGEELQPGESKEYTLDKCNRDYDFKVVYLNNNVAKEHDYSIVCYTKRTIVFKD